MQNKVATIIVTASSAQAAVLAWAATASGMTSGTGGVGVPNGSAGLVRSASGDNVVTLAQGGLAALGTFSNWYQGFNGLKQDYMQIDVADYNGQKVFQIMEQRYSLPMNRFVTVPLYTNSIDFQNVVTGVNWHD